jgi:hypothetical protein
MLEVTLLVLFDSYIRIQSLRSQPYLMPRLYSLDFKELLLEQLWSLRQSLSALVARLEQR